MVLYLFEVFIFVSLKKSECPKLVLYYYFNNGLISDKTQDVNNYMSITMYIYNNNNKHAFIHNLHTNSNA